MNHEPIQTISPLLCSPAGLISWYDDNGVAVAMATSWVALIGGRTPRLKTAWPDPAESLGGFPAVSDFVLNIPGSKELARVRSLLRDTRPCLDIVSALNSATTAATAVVAPLLVDCEIQIECLQGCLAANLFEMELSGVPVRLHLGDKIVDSQDVDDLCAVQPLSVSRRAAR